MNITEMLAPVIKTGARCGKLKTGMIGVTIHNTGNYNSGAGAENHGKYLQGGGKEIQASWHYVVDDKKVIRCIPENEVAWHAGDGQGDGNMKTISVEICVNPDSNLTAATNAAAELVADILKRYQLTAANLYQHNHWSGKDCPHELRAGNPYSWETFLAKVTALMTAATGFAVGDAVKVNTGAVFADGVKPAAWVYGSVLYVREVMSDGRIKVSTNMVTQEITGIFKPEVLTKTGSSSGSAVSQPVYLTVSTKLLPLWLNGGWNGTAPTKKLIKMPKGVQVQLLEKTNSKWFKVKYNGVTGYASAEYLK